MILPDLLAVREALADIIEDDKRAVEVLHRLRSLLRKSPPELLPVNLNEAIQEAVKLLNSDMIIRHVSLVLDLDPDLPLVRGITATAGGALEPDVERLRTQK